MMGAPSFAAFAKEPALSLLNGGIPRTSITWAFDFLTRYKLSDSVRLTTAPNHTQSFHKRGRPSEFGGRL